MPISVARHPVRHWCNSREMPASAKSWRAVAVALSALAVGVSSLSVSFSVPVPASASVVQASAASPKPRVIIDTDLSKWWDDVTALGIANVLARRGRIKLLGIVSDVPNKVAVSAIDAIDTAYRNGDVPIGDVAGSDADTFEHGYTDTLDAKLQHSITDSTATPDAVALYRKLLAAQPDHSVTIVSLGGYSNLGRLLAAPDGPKLIT